MSFHQVSTHRVAKVFGSTRALSGVSLCFRAGEITVLEGPNGSGKSTLLSLLALLAKPSAGCVRFDHVDGQRLPVAARASIALLSHEAMVYPELTGRENLAFFGRLMRGPVTAKQPDDRSMDERLADVVERFELRAFWERPTRTYSRGQLQRVALARTVLQRPRLLLLDEPSTGLDHRSVDLLWQMVEAQRQAGVIVVVVSHDPHCAVRLGARRVCLEKGRVVAAPDGGRIAAATARSEEVPA